MPFLFIFWHSLSDLATYRFIITTPIRQSIFFFLKWYGLVMLGVVVATGIIGYSAGQSFSKQLPTDQTIYYEQNKMTVHGEPLSLIYALPFSFALEAHQESIDLKQSNETISSVPYAALLKKEKVEVATNDLRDQAPMALLFGFATSGMMMVLFVVVSLAASILFHAVVFQYLLQLIGGQFPLKRMAQILIHTTIVAETISAIAFIIYRNNMSISVFEIALVGSTILVLQSLRRPSA